jgi:hypothetical protein
MNNNPLDPTPNDACSAVAAAAAVDDDSPIDLDPINGLPILPPVPKRTFLDKATAFSIRNLLFPVIGPVFLGSFWLANKNNCRQSILATFQVVHGIGYQNNRIEEYQSIELLAKMWQTSSAQHYVQNAALLWQKQEGYCGRATLRCILKSFGCRTDELPPEMRGESKPEKFASHITELAPKRLNITTEIVSGSVDFATFVTTLRKVNDVNCRIAINYLRSALFGFAFPWYLPINFIIGLFGGHFSPVVGVLEQVDHPDDPLVAVFDVNHKYHGAYLVPASRLYQSVAAVDVTSGQHRAVIVVTSAPL